jgi:hypothetical protein
MSTSPSDDLAQRKALLASRSELERMQMAVTLHALRERIAPPRGDPARIGRPATIAAAIVGVGVPLLGRHRLGRMLRSVSLAMTAWRVLRNWRTGTR